MAPREKTEEGWVILSLLGQAVERSQLAVLPPHTISINDTDFHPENKLREMPLLEQH